MNMRSADDPMHELLFPVQDGSKALLGGADIVATERRRCSQSASIGCSRTASDRSATDARLKMVLLRPT